MNGKRWAGLVSLLVIVGIAIWWFLFVDRTPTSLSEALLQRKDELPPQQYVILPPTSQSRLGFEPEWSDDPAGQMERRLSTKPVPCFFVVPQPSSGVTELTVSYKDGRRLAGDWSAALGGVSGQITSEDTAYVTLRDLKAATAVGVPNLSSPCSFDAGAIDIVTSQVVAGSVDVAFSRALTGTGNATGSGSSTTGNASGESSWKKTTESAVQGHDIVISGGVSRVVVDVARLTHNLGNSPKTGYGFALPNGFDGQLTVDRFDDSVQSLSIRAEVTAPTLGAPHSLPTCNPGQTAALRPLALCQYWLSPGNALLAVSWRYSDSPDNAAGRVVLLDVVGYRTRWPDARADRNGQVDGGSNPSREP